MDGDSQLRSTCANSLAMLVHTIDTAGMWMSPEQRSTAYTAGRRFLQTYQSLAAKNFEARVCNYKLRPKMHFFQHVVLNFKTSSANPKYHQTFMDEDMMGRLSKLYRRVHSGKSGTGGMRRAMQRYMLKLSMHWEFSRG
eukprot:15061149-Alexandrium_andersonii.AAC.1